MVVALVGAATAAGLTPVLPAGLTIGAAASVALVGLAMPAKDEETAMHA